MLFRSSKSYHYLDPETGRMIHKKTVWDSARGSHMKEEEFANSSGLVQVEELPKHAWIRKI